MQNYKIHRFLVSDVQSNKQCSLQARHLSRSLLGGSEGCLLILGSLYLISGSYPMAQAVPQMKVISRAVFQNWGVHTQPHPVAQ